MSKPTIVFVPGFWEGPSPFSAIATALSKHGYETVTAPLSSTGKPSPNNPSMYDDIAAIRAVIAPLVEDGKELLLVLHSAGGFLGSSAIKGLSVQERKAEGKPGGVCKLVFLAGAVFEEGFRHGPLPFFDYQVVSFFRLRGDNIPTSPSFPFFISHLFAFTRTLAFNLPPPSLWFPFPLPADFPS